MAHTNSSEEIAHGRVGGNTSHSTHINESRQITNEPRHVLEQVMSHTKISEKVAHGRVGASRLLLLYLVHVTNVDESWHTRIPQKR
mmetsp:Transcript_37866/g.61051  ORF Transcript_37866/g.61051 Transcript_37866/m.61051 type:complete len:86 (-) Transcript_37866:207-464(-)